MVKGEAQAMGRDHGEYSASELYSMYQECWDIRKMLL